MTLYIIKTILCSSVFYLFYHFVLEKEKMHQFKRFYLLAALAASLLIPLITIPAIFQTEASRTVSQEVVYIEQMIVIDEPLMQNEIVEVASSKVDYTNWLWLTLSAISCIFLIRIGLNLLKIWIRCRQNKVIPYSHGVNLVLIENLEVPHSFWKNIFLNKNAYEQNNIDEKILIHELAHVKQKHTADVLLIELLISVFWFNPVLYLYRRAIRLNHEFLADESVINRSDRVTDYQCLLISHAGNSYCTLSSNFNYLITKKRLMMMTKKTSKKKKILYCLLLLPFVAVIGNTLCKQKPNEPMSKEAIVLGYESEPNPDESIVNSGDSLVNEYRRKYDKYKGKSPSDIPKEDTDGMASLIIQMTDEQRDEIGVKISIERIVPEVKIQTKNKPVSESEIIEYQSIVTKYQNEDGSYKGISEKMTTTEREKLKDLYSKMSSKQRKEQKIIVIGIDPPLSKSIPTSDEFESWKNPDRYGIWIDGKEVENAALNKYKNIDFHSRLVSKLRPNAKKGKIYDYQVDLMTIDYYAKYIEQSQNRKYAIYEKKEENKKYFLGY